jgi:peptidoglycan/xylan/chitin deacetylase (PgdA/CDA1 family)
MIKSTRVLSVFWHSVESASFSPDRVYPTEHLFREHIKFLVANFTPVSISEFLEIHEQKQSMNSYDKPPLLLGFDDGFKNVIRRALPVLEEFKVPAVFFVIGEVLRNPHFVPWYVEVRYLIRRTIRKTLVYNGATLDLAGKPNVMRLRSLFASAFLACRADPVRQALLQNFADSLGVTRPQAHDLDEDLQFVDRKDLAALPSSSQLTVASHAMTHRDLALLSDEEQIAELEGSDSLLSLHCPSYYPAVAYPNGSFNSKTLRIARRIYKVGFAVLLGASYRNRYAYTRMVFEKY